MPTQPNSSVYSPVKLLKRKLQKKLMQSIQSGMLELERLKFCKDLNLITLNLPKFMKMIKDNLEKEKKKLWEGTRKREKESLNKLKMKLRILSTESDCILIKFSETRGYFDDVGNYVLWIWNLIEMRLIINFISCLISAHHFTKLLTQI